MKRKSILFVLVIMGLAVTLAFNDLQENNVDNNIGIERNSIQNNKAEEENETEIATDNNEFTLNNDFISSSRHEALNEEIDTENKKVAELEEALKNLKLDPEKVKIQKGDLDKNGIVNANDAAIALDLYKYGNVSDKELLIGDMDNNGIINANDAALILDVYKYGE